MNPEPQGSGPGREPIFNAPPGTLSICGFLVVCHLLFRFVDQPWQDMALDSFAFVPITFLSQFDGQGSGLSPMVTLSLVTHAFLHGDFVHLALNTGFLLAFGTAVERRIGTLRFFVLFACCAAAGALAETIAGHSVPVQLIGASGAVYGMMAAAVPIIFHKGRPKRFRRMLEFVAIIMGLNLIFALVGLGDFLAGAQVAWRAHAGGFAAGLALILVLTPKPTIRRAS